jgi:alpha-tubulin suppressor-like RCC1 family protein
MHRTLLVVASALVAFLNGCVDNPTGPSAKGTDGPLFSISGPVSAIGAGGDFSCAIGPDGRLSCWGDNRYGQAAPPSGTYSFLSVGHAHACAISATDRSITCWGLNDVGQVGGTGGSATTHTHDGPYSDVAAGLGHTCAIPDSGVMNCWGNASGGYYESLLPSGKFSQVSAGFWHTCAISDAGTLTCWGYNVHGQVTGTSTYVAETYTPTGTWASVSAGDYHTCAISTDGTLTCWGFNIFGQVSGLASSSPFTAIATFPGPYTAVTAGGTHTCAVSAGTTTCWGSDNGGQVSGTPNGSAGPYTHSVTYTAVSTGYAHTCAITESGSPVCWGTSANQLIIPPFAQVSAGKGYACGVRPDGRLECWGSDDFEGAPRPTGTFAQVSLGRAHACALSTAGAVSCWGQNMSGQVDPQHPSETAARTYVGPYTAVSAGEFHTCALPAGGNVECWGADFYGQVSGSPPVDDPAVGTFTHTGLYTGVSAGGGHTCAVNAPTQTITCWGLDYYGAVSGTAGSPGIGKATHTGFSAVSAGFLHTCAINATDRSLTCWGWNGYGQVGGTPVPENESGTTYTHSGSWAAVSAAQGHTCGLGIDGAVTCWGDNGNRQRNVFPGLYTQISAASMQTCGLQAGGVVECWGDRTATSYITGLNLPPSLGAISASTADPVPVNVTFSVSAPFSDPNPADTHSATIAWGDGITTDGAVSSGTVSGSHSYTTPGVYTVSITLRDNGGSSSTGIYQFAVVYDPSAGFVTGAGWIDSPAGAYVADPALAGKATFGFVSRYRKGATVPDGSTRFEFMAGGFTFTSTAYDWLVIAGAHARFKGSGMINGGGNYGFMLTATDGAINGGVDGFRIRIWDRSNGDAIVYDNQPLEDDTSNVTTALGGGNIVIHGK